MKSYSTQLQGVPTRKNKNFVFLFLNSELLWKHHALFVETLALHKRGLMITLL